MIAWSVATFDAMPEVAAIVVVTEAELIERMQAVLAPRVTHAALAIVAGGDDRQASVARGVKAAPEGCDAIFVHDGARPLVRPHDVRAAMRIVRPGTAALLAAPVVETVKVARRPELKVTRTLDRTELWAAQTPQCATARDLRRAHVEAEQHQLRATDDATLLERLGLDVIVVPASPENFKVTVPEDLVRAEAIAKTRTVPPVAEDDILLVEVYVDPTAADAICDDLSRRGGTIDGVDRDLPSAAVVRAFVAAHNLRGFGEHLRAVAGPESLYTTHFSHTAPRA